MKELNMGANGRDKNESCEYEIKKSKKVNKKQTLSLLQHLNSHYLPIINYLFTSYSLCGLCYRQEK